MVNMKGFSRWAQGFPVSQAPRGFEKKRLDLKTFHNLYTCQHPVKGGLEVCTSFSLNQVGYISWGETWHRGAGPRFLSPRIGGEKVHQIFFGRKTWASFEAYL